MSASQLEAAFSRDYLAFMECDAGDEWMPAVEAQLASWLRSKKKFEVDLTSDGDYVDGERRLSVRRLPSSSDLRVALLENTAQGLWTTELIAHDERGAADWINLEVRNSEGRFVDVPNIAKWLIEVLPPRDASIEFTTDAQMFRPDRVDDLVELLADDNRNGLVFVAGTDDHTMPVGPFAKKVSEWSKQVIGLAQVIVLDPHATTLFVDRVGERFQAPPWTIRTYLPGVVFDRDLDARRHRILGTERLARQNDRRTQALLGDITRDQAADRVLPSAVRQVRRSFERRENSRIVEVADAPTVVVEPEAVPDRAVTDDSSGQLGLVRVILGLKEITETALHDLAARLLQSTRNSEERRSLEQRVNALQAEKSSLQDLNRELAKDLDDEQQAHEFDRIDADDQTSRLEWLTARFKEKHDYEAVHAKTPAEFVVERPGSFDELVERVQAVPGVVFTGDTSRFDELSLLDTNDTALRAAWDAVQVLEDYVRACAAGDCDKGLNHFINHTPASYRTISARKFAHTETGTTMSGWGDERRFTVPTSVDPSGIVEMKAHFKLARLGRKNPRMYVYDATSATEPAIYIGYLGTHLTNTQT